MLGSLGNTTDVQSLPHFVGLAAAMGAASLLTPCVFPMVPITVSYFSNGGAKSRSATLLGAFTYGLGIVLTFSVLGLAIALLFGAGGLNRFASNPWVNLSIAVVFLAFALSLFEVYFFQLPSALLQRTDRLSRANEGRRVLGALLMGIAFTLTSFTCTGAFVGTLLVAAAEGNWGWPLVGMVVYSSVFALPFVVLAMAPQFLQLLPRAGAWMNTVKGVMGFVEIGASIKFLANADLVWQWGLITRERILAAWIVCCIAIVIYVLRLVPLGRFQPPGVLRAGAAAAFALIAVTLVPGLLGSPLQSLDAFLPPSHIGRRSERNGSSHESEWILNNYELARVRARREHKLIFIDFTGYTCTNCRWMESNVLSNSTVRSKLDEFVTLRLYTDGDGELFAKQQALEQEQFGTVALPFYAIVRDDGRSLRTYAGISGNAVEFSEFLEGTTRVDATASVPQPAR